MYTPKREKFMTYEKKILANFFFEISLKQKRNHDSKVDCQYPCLLFRHVSFLQRYNTNFSGTNKVIT